MNATPNKIRQQKFRDDQDARGLKEVRGLWLDEAAREKLKALGGTDWIKKRIERAKEPKT